MPMIVARQNENVIGFLLSSSKEFNSDNPIICKMLSNYQGSEESYIYGPICVRNTERGMGLAQAMFAELKRCLPEREGILFIRSDNDASLRAHEKMGMNKVSGFTIGSTSYITLSYTA
jgi:predicted GNAT family acetyltransferase